jgi:enoyl-CoA hydratase
MRPDTQERLAARRREFGSPDEYRDIIYDRGIVTRVVLNRPRYMNALSHPIWAEIEDAFDRAVRDARCRVIVLAASGPCFSAGDDVIGMSPDGAPVLADRPRPEELVASFGSEERVWEEYNIEHDYFITWLPLHKLRTCPKPTVAQVHGWCIYAGVMISQAMDVVFASADALFLPPAAFGAWFGDWGLWDLGRHKAMELALEPRFITAQEAAELGLVNRVYPDRETLERETLSFAYRVAAEHPERVRAAKKEILQLLDLRGYATVFQWLRQPSHEVWRFWARLGSPHRFEGPGIARAPVALRNLVATLRAKGEAAPPGARRDAEALATTGLRKGVGGGPGATMAGSGEGAARQATSGGAGSLQAPIPPRAGG